MKASIKIMSIVSVLLLLALPSLACSPSEKSGNSTTGNVTINDFYASVTNGTAPMKVTFTSNVTGEVASWCWILGPKSNNYYSQHAVNATRTYTTPGVYDVTLQVQDKNGKTASLTKKAMIVVNPKTFSKTVTWKVTCKKAVSYTWIFGDGTTTNTVENKISHTYTKKGMYKVTLITNFKNGCSKTTKWTKCV